jgi:hypothetical protein
MAAERIGANDLLYLGRQAVEPSAQIDRLAGEKDLFPGGRSIIPAPHCRQHSPQRPLVDAAIDAHSNPVGQIDLDHPDALRQCAPRAYRTGHHLHRRGMALMRRQRRAAERIPPMGPLGLPLPDPRPSIADRQCTTSSSRSHAGGKRQKPDRPRPDFRPSAPPFPGRPLPAALNHDLAITPSTPSGQCRRTQLPSARCCRPHAADLFRSDAYVYLNQIGVTSVTLTSRPSDPPAPRRQPRDRGKPVTLQVPAVLHAHGADRGMARS